MLLKHRKRGLSNEIISEVDNKAFNTEQECLEHENAVRKSREEELKRKEKLQMEQQNRLDEIYKKDEELRKLVESYKKDYGSILKSIIIIHL